jgi:Domain of unknown function (DUF222)/HNH endonuclease
MLPDDADMAYRLIELRQCIDSLELSFSQLAADFKESKRWEHQGANSAIDWIRFSCNMTSNAVADRIAVGEQSGHLPESILSMKADHIGFAHLTVMARTAAAVGDVFDEKHLLELAENSSPGKFHYKCLHYRHAVNAEKYAADQERLTEGRSLRLNTAEDGCLLISGILDPVGGAAVRGALEPLGRPSGAHDHRRRDQRMADAFVELAMGRKPANLQITASIETLKSMAGAAGGEMEFSLPISSATVQRIACDCSVTRILLDQESMVIDVGRSRRIVTGALRKALELRDKHCQWPGCERPGSWCDGHHFHHWIHGGRTDLDNCVLICKRHHRMVHEGRWQLIRVEGRTVPVAPTFRFAPARGPD